MSGPAAEYTTSLMPSEPTASMRGDRLGVARPSRREEMLAGGIHQRAIPLRDSDEVSLVEREMTLFPNPLRLEPLRPVLSAR